MRYMFKKTVHKRTKETQGNYIGRASLLCAAVLIGTVTASIPAFAQQKTGPGLPEDDSLTWHGITLYGVLDVGVVGVTPSNMGQTRVGLQGIEPLAGDWSAVFQAESFFNPQSGEIANSLKSLAVNNGLSLANQSVGVDGGAAGQAFQTAFVGLQSARFGALTFGRQVTLLTEGTILYDPNYKASAFGLLGASNTYAGGGSSEDDRLDSTAKYLVSFNDLLHLGALYKFNGSNGDGSANTAVQANVGGSIAGASLDAYYSKVNSAITASSLTADQVAALPGLGYSVSDSLAASVSDNTTYSLMGEYKLDPFKFFAGYMYIQYTNPTRPLSAGFNDIGGYILAFVNDTAFPEEKIVQVYWTGARYSVTSNLDLTAAYYGYHQSAYGTGKQADCSTIAHGTCSGGLDAFSFDADYRFNKHVDAYVGARYSGVHDGVASGYLTTTNINPTIGVRYKF